MGAFFPSVGLCFFYVFLADTKLRGDFYQRIASFNGIGLEADFFGKGWME